MTRESNEYTATEVDDAIRKCERLIFVSGEINNSLAGNLSYAGVKTPEQLFNELDSYLDSMKKYEDIPRVSELISETRKRLESLTEKIEQNV